MKKVLLVLVLILGILVSKAQSFTFISIGDYKISGEIIMTDSSITQTINGITATIPLIMVEGSNKTLYKSKSGDWDVRYTFVKLTEDMKSKDKKGRYIVKEEETATHILMIENKDTFTNTLTNMIMYLTPKK